VRSRATGGAAADEREAAEAGEAADEAAAAARTAVDQPPAGAPGPVGAPPAQPSTRAARAAARREPPGATGGAAADEREASSRKPKRKRAADGSNADRRVDQTQAAAEEEDGGFVREGRLALRQRGGVLVTGTRRTCVPDALANLLVVCDADELAALQAMCPGGDADVRFTAADAMVRDVYGFALTRVSREFMSVPDGPALAILRARGRKLIVQLSIRFKRSDPRFASDPSCDLHAVAYDGETIYDNNMYVKPLHLQAKERASAHAARAAFDALYPTMEVRIKNVYELQPCA
jgi:hypothetical protein